MMKKHIILGKPILGAILVILWWDLMFQLCGVSLQIVFGAKNPVWAIGTVLFFFLVLAFHKFWFRGEYKGSFAKIPQKDPRLVRIAAIAMLLDLLIAISTLFFTGIDAMTAHMAAQALQAGTTEEIIFRAIPLSIIMRAHSKEKNRIKTALILPAVIFGLIHLGNLGAGADFKATILQVVFAVNFGFFAAAVYLHTGNIAYTMIFHVLHDFIGFFEKSQSTGVVTKLAAPDLITSLLITVVLLIATVLLMRGQDEAITKVWSERWKKAVERDL